MTVRATLTICALTLLSVLPLRTAPAQDENAAGYGRFIELLVYRARPEHRDTFVQYFEEHFLESQEVLGSRIWGQFRDLDDPASFVWVRGFQSMDERKSCLEQFYSSDTWFEYRPAVLQMLVSAANTRLLEPAGPGDAFEADLRRQPVAGDPHGDPDWEANAGIVVVEVFVETKDNADHLIGIVRARADDAMVASGAHSLGLYRSSEEPNSYPRLPLIEHERVVVWFGSFESEGSYRAAAEAANRMDNSLLPRDAYVLSPGQRSRLFNRPDAEQQPIE